MEKRGVAMKRVMNRQMMQEIDRITINEYKVPAVVLMERAALKVAEHVSELYETQARGQKILVVCGVGNNGGDGVATARMLFQKGYVVEVQVVGDSVRFSEQMKLQVEIANRLGVPFVNEPSYNEYCIIVDAIFGVGLSRDVGGIYEAAIEAINASDARVVAVDLPSGVNADDGSILHVAVKAEMTVTFGYHKVGLIRYPGCEYAGKVFVEDVGFVSQAYETALKQHKEWMNFITYTKEDLKLIPKRPQHSHKGTFGTVLVVAGSKGMSGACYFSAKAALRSGAGLVKVMTVEENREIIQTSLPEAIVLTYNETKLQDEAECLTYQKAIEDADVVVVGPGLGRNHLSLLVLEIILKFTRTWTILDADGINLLDCIISANCKNQTDDKGSERDRIKRRFDDIKKILPEKIILTPHLKELSRLLKMDVYKINKNFVDIIDICSYNKFLICIIKDSNTTVVQGKICYLNQSGNDALATGGTGDTLAGIISGLLAQGIQPYEAACLGVYTHGLTSELFSIHQYSGSMIASDVIDRIGEVIGPR